MHRTQSTFSSSNHKWTRIIFIISNSKLGIWLCSQPRIDLNSQSKFYDVLTRPYKYFSNTLYKTTCTEHNLNLVSPGVGKVLVWPSYNMIKVGL